MSFVTPLEIGGYRPLRVLNRGSNATVYCCRDPDGEEVALKCLDYATPALLRRFRKEIATLERIDDPHIVRHLDHGEWQGRPFLVMELLQGHDLRILASKLHQRPATERYETVRRIGRDLCKALAHLHRLGLVHRDVKPSNVMWTEDGRVVLSDFGIVKDLMQPDHTEVGMIIGTMAFAAPEQLGGDRVDTRSDLFGLGATLYYLLTLERPYDSLPRSPNQRPIAPSHHEPGIPPDLETVVLRLMAFQPQHRYPDARAASMALGQGRAEGLPIAGRRMALERVAEALRAASRGESICLRASGPIGAGKGWLADMVRQGARARSIRAYEIRELGEGESAISALVAGEPCVVVDAIGLSLPSTVRVIEVPLVPLGLADVRRTVVGVAPRTMEPALVSDRLHRLSGGIAGLLVPLITRYSEDGAIVLPDVIESPALVDAFFEDLELDEMEILGVIALAWPPPTARLIEEVTQVPVEEALNMMKDRGLVVSARDEWMLAASLFRPRVEESIADPEGVRLRIERTRLAIGSDFTGLVSDVSALLEQGHIRVMSGSLGLGQATIDRARELARGLGERVLEARSMRLLGMSFIDTGCPKSATRWLSDATALARACGEDEERRLCHVLRARISLDLQLSDGSGKLAALDRLMSIGSGSRGRSEIRVSDVMMHAVWCRISAEFGDMDGIRKHEDAALSDVEELSEEWQARARLEMAIAWRTAGNEEGARLHLEMARTMSSKLPLLSWWVERTLGSLTGTPVPFPHAMRAGLDEARLVALESISRG